MKVIKAAKPSYFPLLCTLGQIHPYRRPQKPRKRLSKILEAITIDFDEDINLNWNKCIKALSNLTFTTTEAPF